MQRNRVVLPAPSAPTTPHSAPDGTARSTWSSARVRPNVFTTPSARISIISVKGLPEAEGSDADVGDGEDGQASCLWPQVGQPDTLQQYPAGDRDEVRQ